ncbi:MAG: EamA family transporter [Actinobacteria bacterium]|nr:EamA family transporter [Actinomycetota bacterium]
MRTASVARRRAGGRTAVGPPDRTVLLLLALYACWGSAIPAMKLMVATVPPVGGAALVFLLAGVVLAGAARGRPRPTRGQLRRLAAAGVLLLVGGQGLATVALTAVTATLGAILAAAIPLWVVLLSGLTGIRVPAASWVRLAAGFRGIVIVVVTAPGSAIGGAPWAVAAFCVAPIMWAAGSLLTANAGRPPDRVAAGAVQLLAGGTVLLLAAVPLGELDPARWSDISPTSAGAAVFLLVFDSLAGFMLYTRLLESAPAPLVSTYAYVTPLVGAVIGATVLAEPLWAGAFAGGALVIGAVALELRGRSGLVHPDPGVEHRVQQVHHDVGDDNEERGQQHDADDHRQVLRGDGLHGQRPQARQAEDVLGDHHAAEDDPQVDAGLGDDRGQRAAQRVYDQYPPA